MPLRRLSFPQTSRVLRVLSDCNQALVRATDEATLLQTICQVLVERGGYSVAWVGLLEDSLESQLRPVAQYGSRVSDLPGVLRSWAMLQHVEEPTVTALHSGRPTLVTAPHPDLASISSGIAAYAASYVGVMVLPLTIGDSPLGVLTLYADEAQAFDTDEMSLLAELADDLAFGIITLRTRLAHTQLEAALQQALNAEQQARARLRQVSQRLLDAQERERRLIARELHDETGQALGALKINLHVLQSLDDPEARGQRLQECSAIVDQLLQQVRSLSLDLRPALLDDLGLGAALEWYAHRLALRTSIQIEVANTLGDELVPPDVATASFRLVQEALTNVVRHAQAQHVLLSISVQDAMLALSVRDDGVGFDVAATRERAIAGASLGLISMAERAELAGGWLDIASLRGQGTEVYAWFPLTHEPFNDPS